MAADEALLESAGAGVASLRFYGWSAATLSLGYFQTERLRQEDPRLAPLPYVRRPSGGATLVHHQELTYALALPAGSPWQEGDPWLRRMHRVVARALDALCVKVQVHEPAGAEDFPGFLCFQHCTAGDLLIERAKIVGSAQRRQRRALLQHGAILLARSPYTPVLPGIQELSGRRLTAEETAAAIRDALQRETGWEIGPADWTEAERQRRRELAVNRYSQDSWNRKR